jgi:hypothetical protein
MLLEMATNEGILQNLPKNKEKPLNLKIKW